jgi:hypothetical protein
MSELNRLSGTTVLAISERSSPAVQQFSSPEAQKPSSELLGYYHKSLRDK